MNMFWRMIGMWTWKESLNHTWECGGIFNYEAFQEWILWEPGSETPIPSFLIKRAIIIHDSSCCIAFIEEIPASDPWVLLSQRIYCNGLVWILGINCYIPSPLWRFIETILIAYVFQGPTSNILYGRLAPVNSVIRFRYCQYHLDVVGERMGVGVCSSCS